MCFQVLSVSPHAGFLESDRLSTTQVEKTGVTNRIQIFLTWKKTEQNKTKWYVTE